MTTNMMYEIAGWGGRLPVLGQLPVLGRLPVLGQLPLLEAGLAAWGRHPPHPGMPQIPLVVAFWNGLPQFIFIIIIISIFI